MRLWRVVIKLDRADYVHYLLNLFNKFSKEVAPASKIEQKNVLRLIEWPIPRKLSKKLSSDR